ncbi:PREDICTED: trichohyalin-like [Priapulus caudatus]|uniref:Trichohyalin-like n=1 Tax=Priapulus caudatus TaxID=37621 RepID=A0ABM1EC90_PRICU|nr:PREDICTED: trichohyalin-like [Priapulus caudatus]
MQERERQLQGRVTALAADYERLESQLAELEGAECGGEAGGAATRGERAAHILKKFASQLEQKLKAQKADFELDLESRRLNLEEAHQGELTQLRDEKTRLERKLNFIDQQHKEELRRKENLLLSRYKQEQLADMAAMLAKQKTELEDCHQMELSARIKSLAQESAKKSGESDKMRQKLIDALESSYQELEMKESELEETRQQQERERGKQEEEKERRERERERQEREIRAEYDARLRAAEESGVARAGSITSDEAYLTDGSKREEGSGSGSGGGATALLTDTSHEEEEEEEEGGDGGERERKLGQVLRALRLQRGLEREVWRATSSLDLLLPATSSLDLLPGDLISDPNDLNAENSRLVAAATRSIRAEGERSLQMALLRLDARTEREVAAVAVDNAIDDEERARQQVALRAACADAADALRRDAETRLDDEVAALEVKVAALEARPPQLPVADDDDDGRMLDVAMAECRTDIAAIHGELAARRERELQGAPRDAAAAVDEKYARWTTRVDAALSALSAAPPGRS